MLEIKRYFDQSITIEFYINMDREVHVVYNTKDYLFNEFWHKIPDAKDICYLIYEQFHYQFPRLFKGLQSPDLDWMGVFLEIVNFHLGKKDRILDVFIRQSGDVELNLEM